MQTRQVSCPSCGIVLDVPPGCADCNVRCGGCHTSFRLSRRIAVTDDCIASWLGEGMRRPDLEDEDFFIESQEPAADGTAVPTSFPGTAEDPGLVPAAAPAIRLVKFGERGALFEFPASRLRETPFRCGMPRRCMRCGGRNHLMAHVIIFSSQLVDSISMEDEHTAGELIIGKRQVGELPTEELLGLLPMVPNVPPPGNLPMPFWVCDMCSGAGLIGGQIDVNTETGEGWCRLLVQNLRRAEEFMENVGGGNLASFEQLHRHVLSLAENPWDQLPSAIQHRIEQWWRPAKAEQFIAYVPDRDFARTEDGMSGLLISSRRLIYHTPNRHRECRSTDAIKCKFASDGSKGSLLLEAPSWALKHFIVDRDGIMILRRAFTIGGYRPMWA